MSKEEALSCCRGLPADVAAAQIVKVTLSICKVILYNYYFLLMVSHTLFDLQEAIQIRGLRDDTTCIVIDILPPEKRRASSIPPPKKQGKGAFKSLFQRKSSDSSSHLDREFSESDLVEEIFEEGSAVLAERLVVSSKI